MSQILKEKPGKGLVVIIAICAVVGAATGSAAVKALFRSNPSDATIDKVLAETASDINRNLPMMVDQFTRINATAPLPGKKLLYKYTLLNLDPLPDRQTIIDSMRPITVNNYKTSQEMDGLREMGVTLVYSYADEKGNEIARFEIGPQDIK